MASIGTVSVRIGEEPRPCIVWQNSRNVTIETKAFFHCWGIHQHTVNEILIGQKAGQVSYMTAIVELPSGEVVEVRPAQVRFLDSAAKFGEYAWEE